MKKAVLCEFGDSHDDIFYGQLDFLKKSGYETHFIGHSIFKNRLSVYDNLDFSYFLNFGKGQLSNFWQIYLAWKYIRTMKIDTVILNTIEGTPVRNFCLFPFGKRTVSGIIHNAGNLDGNSTTFNKIIIPKIRKMFTLNSYVWENTGKNTGIQNQWIYPITFPKYNKVEQKPNDEFRVVVPGLVESDRRDYFHLLNSISGIELPTNLKIYFLGKSMHPKGIGPEIKRIIKQNNLENNVILFEEFVEWDYFRSCIEDADLLAPLIHPNYRNFGNYSTNKITGTYLLSFAHKIPLLSHEYFKSYKDINISSVFYNQDNFTEVLLNIFNNRDVLKSIKENMLKNKNFDFEFNRQKYIKLLVE